MNWLDITIIALLAVFVVEGVTKGFVRQIVGVVALLLGILLSVWFYGTAGSFLLPYVSKPAIANLLGFLMVFVGVQLLGGLAGWTLSKAMKATGLGWLDRLMGAAFGFVKAALAGVVLVMVITAFPLKPLPDAIAGSRFAPYLIDASHVITYLAPRELRDGFVETYQRLRDYWIKHDPRTGNKLPSAEA
ncbi:MAG TPA: CvpA family protein [Bryobacteraceae bacterium]|nr:CvpA family protein [Bryobacteraceae bacterium]